MVKNKIGKHNKFADLGENNQRHKQDSKIRLR